MPKIYSITDTASVLNISTRSVYDLIYNGKLRAAKICGKWAIKPEWVDEYIDASEIKAEKLEAAV